MLSLDPGMMIWTVATFICLLILLYRMAWKPILTAIDTREKTIRDSLESAQKERQEAQALLEKHQVMMHHAENEAKKIIAEYKAKAEKMHKEMISQSKEEAENIISKAQSEINAQKEAAVIDLRHEIADMVVNAASKFINVSMNEEQQKRLIDQYISDIPVTNSRRLQ